MIMSFEFIFDLVFPFLRLLGVNFTVSSSILEAGEVSTLVQVISTGENSFNIIANGVIYSVGGISLVTFTAYAQTLNSILGILSCTGLMLGATGLILMAAACLFHQVNKSHATMYNPNPASTYRAAPDARSLFRTPQPDPFGEEDDRHSDTDPEDLPENITFGNSDSDNNSETSNEENISEINPQLPNSGSQSNRLPSLHQHAEDNLNYLFEDDSYWYHSLINQATMGDDPSYEFLNVLLGNMAALEEFLPLSVRITVATIHFLKFSIVQFLYDSVGFFNSQEMLSAQIFQRFRELIANNFIHFLAINSPVSPSDVRNFFTELFELVGLP